MDSQSIDQGGAPVSATNPLPVVPVVGGAVIAPGNPLPVSGTVGISGTVPISAAAPIPVSGTVTATVPNPLPVSGTVGITGTPTVAISGTVPISGNVAVTNTPTVACTTPTNTYINARVFGTGGNDATVPTDSSLLSGIGTTGSSLNVATKQLFYDPASNTWGINKGTGEVVVLTSAVRAATTNSATMTQQGNKGVIIVFDMTAFIGGQTVTPSLETLDPASGKWSTIWTGSSRGSAITDRYTIYPDYTPGIGAREAISKNWRIKCTHSGAGNFTYSVGASYIQ